MKALISMTFLVEVDHRAQAEMLRDAMDLGAWGGMRDKMLAQGLTEDDIAELLVIFPTSLTLERAGS